MNTIEFNFEYPEKLQPVLTTDKRYILLKGGRGGGKSHFFARKLLSDRLHQRRDLLCVRETQESLEESSYKTLKTIIELYKLPFKVMSNKIFSLTTGSEIVFKGMSDITAGSIKSYENFHDAWIEEGQYFSRPSFQLLTPTIRQEDSKIYISMNSLYDNDVILDEIQNVHYDNSLIIHLNYYDNPFCPQSLIDEAESYRINKPDEYKHLFLGEPKSGSGLKVVKDWTAENEKDIEYHKELPLVIGMDFNRDPMSWVLCHKDKEALYCFKEFIRDNTWIRPCIKELLDIYEKHEGGFILCGDASGNQLRSEGEGSCWLEVSNEFVKRGYKQINANEIEAGEYWDGNEYKSTKGGRYFAFNLSGANPSRSARFNSFNNLVVNEHGQRNLFINKKECPWLYYNIRNLKQKAGSNDFDIPTITQVKNDPTFINELKYLGHPYDALSYIGYKYFPCERLTEKRY
jgi:hypothetical protein